MFSSSAPLFLVFASLLVFGTGVPLQEDPSRPYYEEEYTELKGGINWEDATALTKENPAYEEEETRFDEKRVEPVGRLSDSDDLLAVERNTQDHDLNKRKTGLYDEDDDSSDEDDSSEEDAKEYGRKSIGQPSESADDRLSRDTDEAAAESTLSSSEESRKKRQSTLEVTEPGYILKEVNTESNSGVEPRKKRDLPLTMGLGPDNAGSESNPEEGSGSTPPFA